MVEGARLESECAGNRTVGSNPTLSVNCSLAGAPLHIAKYISNACAEF